MSSKAGAMTPEILLAENQGGRLLLERSAPGEGSTFRFEVAPAVEPAH